MAGDLGKYADESRVSADMSEREREREREREVLWQILLKKSSRERERERGRERDLLSGRSC